MFIRATSHSWAPAASQTEHQPFHVCSADVSQPLLRLLSQPVSGWSWVTSGHTLCLCLQMTLTLHEVRKSTCSHSVPLSHQCWQSSLFLSCRLAETDPFRDNIHQHILFASCDAPTSQLAAGIWLFMARAPPEPLESLFYHSCQESGCLTHTAWPQVFAAGLPRPGLGTAIPCTLHSFWYL